MSTSFYARADNNTANNPALNLIGDPAVLITFVEPSGGGDVILNANGGLPDSNTLVEINGADYEFVFEYSGTLPTQKRDGSQQVPDQFEGDVVLLITVIDYPAPGDETRLAFLPESGATQAEMDDFGNGAIDVQALDTNPPDTSICFARGTLIATPDGDRPIEDLSEGDLVLNEFGQAVPILWIAFSHFTFSELQQRPNLRPVCIPKDRLGRGMPFADLWVSPQHRVVLRGWATELNLGQEAVFIPAKHLMGEPPTPGPRWYGGVDYFHLLLETHDVVVSNGLESESFFVGEEALGALNEENRAFVLTLVEQDESYPNAWQKTCLTTVNKHESMVLRDALRGMIEISDVAA